MTKKPLPGIGHLARGFCWHGASASFAHVPPTSWGLMVSADHIDNPPDLRGPCINLGKCASKGMAMTETTQSTIAPETPSRRLANLFREMFARTTGTMPHSGVGPVTKDEMPRRAADCRLAADAAVIPESKAALLKAALTCQSLAAEQLAIDAFEETLKRPRGS